MMTNINIWLISNNFFFIQVHKCFHIFLSFHFKFPKYYITSSPFSEVLPYFVDCILSRCPAKAHSHNPYIFVYSSYLFTTSSSDIQVNDVNGQQGHSQEWPLASGGILSKWCLLRFCGTSRWSATYVQILIGFQGIRHCVNLAVHYWKYETLHNISCA